MANEKLILAVDAYYNLERGYGVLSISRSGGPYRGAAHIGTDAYAQLSGKLFMLDGQHGCRVEFRPFMAYGTIGWHANVWRKVGCNG